MKLTAVVPAAGVGKRMQADKPKQYLQIAGKTILEHTLERLIAHPAIEHVVLALDPQDPYFEHLSLANAPWLTRVKGGKERADSVLNALKSVQSEWALVHDAARPCIQLEDISKLLELIQTGNIGGILASPVRDTMKRAQQNSPFIQQTEEREGLWHALTPQLFTTAELTDALNHALIAGAVITDEASAIEWAGGQVALVEGSATNIKVTRPADLKLAEFYLTSGE